MKLTKKYKQYQNKFTKLIHKWNKSLDEDNLWLGRFHILQVRSGWEWFDDNSGGILHTVVRCFDKKTRQYKDYCVQYAPWMRTINWKIGMEILNNFIVDVINVWDETPNPRESVKDWTNINDYKTDDNDNEHLSLSLYILQSY